MAAAVEPVKAAGAQVPDALWIKNSTDFGTKS
jgi:hypothetical protein